MPNITKLPIIQDFNDTTTFVVINNGITKRLTYKDVKDKLAVELSTLIDTGGGGNNSSIGLGSRTTVSATTVNLVASAAGNITLTGFKSYALLKVETSSQAWVRIYSSSSARSADAVRLIGNDPIPGSGVIAEIISTLPADNSQIITPATIGFNAEDPISNNIYCSVTNRGSGSTSIVVTLTLLQLEA